MCLILLAWRQHSRYPLIITANRDECYARPTQAACFWEDSPGVLGGRDLESGGTWLGVTRNGRFAALTNYRESGMIAENTDSRGVLVRRYLEGIDTAGDYLTRVVTQSSKYRGFNLLAGNTESLHYFSNRGGSPTELPSGLYGLSNHLLDTPWPKVEAGKAALRSTLREAVLDIDALFRILGNKTPAPDEQLPDTGVGLEWERLLSPIFVESERYGTRSSTILLLDSDNQVSFIERSVDGDSCGLGTRQFEFSLSAASNKDVYRHRSRS